MRHHFEVTHSQPLTVQRRVKLSAEEWNYLQLSVIGAASAISLIVSTISQRWTNGDGLGLTCHHTVVWWWGLEAMCSWSREIADSKPELENDDIWRAGPPCRAAHQASVFWQTHSDRVGFWKLRPCLDFNGDNLRGKLKKWVKAALLSGDCEKCLP